MSENNSVLLSSEMRGGGQLPELESILQEAKVKSLGQAISTCDIMDTEEYILSYNNMSLKDFILVFQSNDMSFKSDSIEYGYQANFPQQYVFYFYNDKGRAVFSYETPFFSLDNDGGRWYDKMLTLIIPFSFKGTADTVSYYNIDYPGDWKFTTERVMIGAYNGAGGKIVPNGFYVSTAHPLNDNQLNSFTENRHIYDGPINKITVIRRVRYSGVNYITTMNPYEQHRYYTHMNIFGVKY